MSALFKATAIVLVVVGISVLIILPVHYPTHQMLPTIVPIVGAIASALGVGMVLWPSEGQKTEMASLLPAIGFGAVAFVLTWYLVMFVVLNVNGS